MNRRRLGKTGLEVSPIGVGCWGIGGPNLNLGLPIGWGAIDDDDALAGLENAYELGTNLFDVADVYGHGRAERTLGRLVAQVPRERIVLSSKVGYFVGTAAHGYEPAHMRHQLEQTLTNLGTDHLDIYFFHHPDFGDGDRYLDAALETMRSFHAQGLVRAVGMRGPHRHALHRLDGRPLADKYSRFMDLFELIRPDVLAVRDNLLTPQSRAGIFDLADLRDCGVLINKPLAQGLLTGSHDPHRPRSFGPADHRSRKRWFTPEGVAIIAAGLSRLRDQLDITDDADLVRIALASCLERSSNAAVLVGFTASSQIAANLRCIDRPVSPDAVTVARTVMADTQRQLDDAGQVFVDELPARPNMEDSQHG